MREHGDLRVQIFLDQARRGRPAHFLRGATLHPPLTVYYFGKSFSKLTTALMFDSRTGRMLARFWRVSVIGSTTNKDGSCYLNHNKRRKRRKTSPRIRQLWVTCMLPSDEMVPESDQSSSSPRIFSYLFHGRSFRMQGAPRKRR